MPTEATPNPPSRSGTDEEEKVPTELASPCPSTLPESEEEVPLPTQGTTGETMQETTQKTHAPEPDLHMYVLKVRAESQEYLKKHAMDEVKLKDDQRAVCTQCSRVFQNEVFPLPNPCKFCN